MTAPTPLPPEQNIGPYYRNVGIFLMGLLALVILTILASVAGITPPLSDLAFKLVVGMAGALGIALFVVIWRPGAFDNAFRTLISVIPWTKYQGQPPAGAS